MKTHGHSLAEGGVKRQVTGFALTALAGLVFNSVYSLTDALFVGRGVSDAAMGGVSAVYPFVILQSAIATAVGGGAASLVSRALGGGDGRKAARVTLSAMTAFYVTAVIVTAVGFAAMPQLLDAMGATGELLDHARTYFIIILAGNVFSTGFSSVIRAEGGSFYSLLIWVIPISVNIVLDAVLIFALDLGVAGSAAGTVAAQFVSFSMSVLWFSRFSCMSFKGVHPTLADVGAVIGIGIPSLVQTGSLSVISAIINSLLSQIDGEAGVTAFGYMSRLITFAVAPFTAVAQALAPVAGFNYGAGDSRRTKETLRFCALLAAACAAAVLVVAESAAEGLMRIFTSDEALISRGAHGLRVLAAALPFMPVSGLAGAFMQATGRKAPALAFYAAIPVAFVPFAYGLSYAAGTDGVWWAYVLSSAAAAVFAAAVLAVRRDYFLCSAPYIGRNVQR